MILRRMTACFGRLAHETLPLHEGLNVLQIPNEGGKSTWSEFLLAMLYGVDTRAREKGGALPVKAKYLPWSGSPMEGSLELEQNGRRLLLTRESTPKAPLGRAALLDMDTGTQLPPDGERLVGAEKSVYERSGFLRQQQLSVTPDGALERRLGSLITAGSEDYSYLTVSAGLRRLQNACRHNSTGVLPQTERALADKQAQLGRVRQAQARLADLAAQEQSAQKERAALRERLEQTEQKARQTRLAEAQRALDAAAEDRAQWARVCAENPPEETLERLERELAALGEQAQTAAQGGSELLSPEQALQDARRVRELQRVKARWVPLLLALLGVAVLAVGVLVWTPLCALGGASALAAVLLWLGRRKRSALAAELLARCGVPDADALQALAERTRAARQARETASAVLRQRRESFLTELRAYLPDCGTTGEAAAYLSEARQSLTQLRRAEHEQTLAQERLAFAAAAPAPETGERQSLAARLADCERSLAQLRSEADRQRGTLDQLGDALALCGEIEALSVRRDSLLQTERALMLAQDALQEADEQLRAEFSPLLCDEASALFSDLTGGRYDRVLLDRSFTVTVREAGSRSLRPLPQLSGGTQEQLYLALRLAICRLLLPDAPLILDDALVFFDDLRAKQALKVLKTEAKNRQILLFTCQSREKKLLETL